MRIKSVKNLNSSVYYHGQYWNDIPRIAEYISEILTGDKNKGWIAHIKEDYAQRPFEHALFLNCGDGRWEREFIDRKIVKKVTAFDISPDLVKKAKNLKGKRNIKYIVADANKITFKENSFDLVVNMAALHHVQYLNRLCFVVAKALRKGGLFISYDFVGPGRNQYPLVNFLFIKLINLTLPRKFRKPTIGYPHLPTMLATDPTEAIHSDMIDKTVRRYFKIFDERKVGGGIAYELFTHNTNFSNNTRYSKMVNSNIERVLKIDKFLTKINLVPVFFSFTLSNPDKQIIKSNAYVRHFQDKENSREFRSQKLYNTYNLKNFIVMLFYTGSWRKRLSMLMKFLEIGFFK